MPKEQPFNVLLFTTDQHRGDHLGVAGHPVLETPNFDAIVRQGAYFPNAYTEIPSTPGARRCLHGGQGSYDCGLIGHSNHEWIERNTLAQVLADNGYHCLNVGWRNMHPRRKLYGFHSVIPHDLREGSDDYWDFLKERLGPQSWEFDHIVDMNNVLARPWPYPEHWHPTVWTTNVCLEQIRKRDPTRPFFMWVSHQRPHSPYDPPPGFWDMCADKEIPEPVIGDWAGEAPDVTPGQGIRLSRGRLAPDSQRRMRVGYMGSVAHLDFEFGRLMERLRRWGLIQNTLVVFVADHGDQLGDHYLFAKFSPYEGSARIPFMIQYPKGCDLPTGQCDQVVGLQDVMPTILEMAGCDIPDSVTGRSVLGALRGEPGREFIHGEHCGAHVTTGCQYLTDGREKYVWLPRISEERFFDLANDRQELRNLAADPAWAQRVEVWRRRLIDLLGRRGDGFSDGEKLLPRPEGWKPNLRPEETLPEPAFGQPGGNA